jgi:glutathione-regulated potassium-efflux system ancillary protein KefF
MKKVLVVSGHTDLNDSVANNIILEELKKQLPEADFSILSEEYPDFNINVEKEQARAAEADIMVWQFPVFWYSMPSLLRRWIEQVCVHGFAYGSNAENLKGTKLIPSFTTGAPESTYQRDVLGFDINDLMDPQLKGTAGLCNMDLQPSIITFGVSYALRNDSEQMDEIKRLAHDHATRLIEAIKAL